MGRGIALTDEQRSALACAYAASEAGGPPPFASLINGIYGTAEQASMPCRLAKRVARQNASHCQSSKTVETELKQAANSRIKLIAMGEPDATRPAACDGRRPRIYGVKSRLVALGKTDD